MSRQFTWWRRFHATQKLDRKEMFKGASKLLQRIEAGEFEADGLWEQSYLEDEILEVQFEEFKKSKPKASQDLYETTYRDMRKKKNKRVNIMRSHHIDHELIILYSLREELSKEFDIDKEQTWEIMETFDGTTRELYFYVKAIAECRDPKTPEQVAQIPLLFYPQPRHVLKRSEMKWVPLWRKILSKYNFYMAYPYE